MIVIGILGIVLAMGVPAIYRVVHREGMRKAVADIVEICSNARAQAILQGVMTEVRFHPLDRRLEATGGGGASRPASAEGFEVGASVPVRSGLSAQLPDSVIIEMLDVNFIEYREAEEARVRFFPNGTCDEMTIILRSDQGEFQKISLEITTGLANVESDRRRW